jgi:peptide/nickel transport system permease protein
MEDHNQHANNRCVLNGRLDIFIDALRHIILPVLTLAYLWWAYLLRITRSSMLEVLRKDYIRTARAKGVPERIVIRKHAKRNAMIPVITVAGGSVMGLLGGTVFVETIFSRVGMGRFLADAASLLDYWSIIGGALFFSFIMVVGNLVVDVSYALVDPRIRLERGEAIDACKEKDEFRKIMKKYWTNGTAVLVLVADLLHNHSDLCPSDCWC